MTPTIEDYKRELENAEARIMSLTLELMNKRIDALENSKVDHEDRLRGVETSRTRFETLAWLAFGGGAISLLNIIQAYAK